MKLRAWAGRSGGLLLGGCLLDHAHDVGLLHDEEILAVDAHLGAGPLAEQHAVARLEIKRLHRAVLIASAWSDGDHLALLGLFLGRIGNDDPALGFLFAFDAADDNTVVQGTKLHELLLWVVRPLRPPMLLESTLALGLRKC